MSNTQINKTINFGNCLYGKFHKKVEVSFSWDGKRFAAAGSIGNEIGGQCLEEIAALPELINNEKLQRIIAVWRKYHLNDMNAGTPEQSNELERRRIKSKFDSMPDYETQCNWLKEANLYEVIPTTETVALGGMPTEVENGSRGYRYGERWLFRKIPDGVVAEIESW